MLKIWGEQKLENHIHVEFGADVFEFWWLFGDREQENISLFVGTAFIIGGVESILDNVLSVQCP